VNLSYATRLDWIFLCCYLIQMCAVGEGFLMYGVVHFAKRHNEKRQKEKKRAEKTREKPVDVQWEKSTPTPTWSKHDLQRTMVLLRKFDLCFMALLGVAAIAVFIGFSVARFPNPY
jgi:hypothetical protein